MSKANPGSPKERYAYNNLLSKFQGLDQSNNGASPRAKGKSPRNAKLQDKSSNDSTNNDNNTTTNTTTATTTTQVTVVEEDTTAVQLEVTQESGAASAGSASSTAEEEKEDANSNNEQENNAMAAEEETRTIEQWLQDNKLYNSELLVVLKANHVDNEDDLKSFFEEADDIASVIKSVRKRTEKQLGGFVKKVNELTDLDYEYRPPRHRAKGTNASRGSAARNDSSLNVGKSASPRNRSASNSSVGSTGSVGSYTYRKHRGRPAPTGKEVQVEANAFNSRPLKEWLQRQNIFQKDLFQYLANHGYQTPDDLEVLTEKEFDRIVREVRVETFKDVDDQRKRQRVDKLLVKFEVEWRKLSGLRKTNMTKEQQEQWGYSPRTASQRALDEQESGGFFDDD